MPQVGGGDQDRRIQMDTGELVRASQAVGKHITLCVDSCSPVSARIGLARRRMRHESGAREQVGQLKQFNLRVWAILARNQVAQTEG